MQKDHVLSHIILREIESYDHLRYWSSEFGHSGTGYRWPREERVRLLSVSLIMQHIKFYGIENYDHLELFR